MGRLGVATTADIATYSLSDDFKALSPGSLQAYVDRAENAIARRGPFDVSKTGYADDMKIAVVRVAERMWFRDDPDRVRMAAQGISRFSAGSYSQTNELSARVMDPLNDTEVLQTIGAYYSGTGKYLAKDDLDVQKDPPVPVYSPWPWVVTGRIQP